MNGQFPELEEELICDDYRFKVMSLSNRRIEEILITLPNEE